MTELLSVVLALHTSWHLILSVPYPFHTEANKGRSYSFQMRYKLVLPLASGWRAQEQLTRPQAIVPLANSNNNWEPKEISVF